MYCGKCGEMSDAAAAFCSTCGSKLTVSVVDEAANVHRPIAGIVVAGLVGVIGLIWGAVELFMLMYAEPTEFDIAFHEAFPEIEFLSILWLGVGFIGNSALVAGVILSFMRHKAGNTTVRVTSWIFLLSTAASLFISYNSMTSSPAWTTLDASLRGALIGGTIGGMLGSAAIFGLIIFLFRKSRWP